MPQVEGITMSSGGKGAVVLVCECGCVEWQHLIDGSGRRLGLLVLRKRFCDRYESVKRHGGLNWAVVNVLVF